MTPTPGQTTRPTNAQLHALAAAPIRTQRFDTLPVPGSPVAFNTAWACEERGWLVHRRGAYRITWLGEAVLAYWRGRQRG